MNKLKIEILAQKLHNVNYYGNREDFSKAQKDFANWAYKMACSGRLYCSNDKGEVRKVEIKE